MMTTKSSRKDLEILYGASVELDKRKCEASLAYFMWRAWDVLEPGTPLEWNWHLTYICNVLQKEAIRISKRGLKEYDTIIISVPPRSLKSSIGAKALQPWTWTWDPSQRFLTASNNNELALEHCVASRRLTMSPWYQERWGDVWQYQGDQKMKSFSENSKTGYRMATSAGGSAIGRGALWILADDIQSREDAESETIQKATKDWWDQTLSTRLNDPRIGTKVLIMQRLSENDIAAHIISRMGNRCLYICLPAEDGDNVSPKKLRKNYVGGLLFPKRMDRGYLDMMRRTMGDYAYSSQYLQRPSPPEGGTFKRQWWRLWKPASMQIPNYEVKVGDQVVTLPTVDLPERFDDSLCSWDMSFKKTDDTDFVVGQVWGSVKADKYLLDQVRERMDFPTTVEKVMELRSRYPKTNAVVIEAKANGQAVIDQIKREVPGVIGFNPQGSKTARAQPLARQTQAGNIYLPHPAIAPWVEGFIERFASFPNVAYDDEIDSASQAVIHMSGTDRVWPGYAGQAWNYAVGFDKLDHDSKLICSQWVDSKLNSSCILAVWNPKKHTLAIFDELMTNNARPETVLVELSRKIKKISNGAFSNMKNFLWYSNSVMFSNKDSGDMKSLYRKYKINLLENKNYDEFGGREFVSRLLDRHNILVHERCSEVVRQMSAWSMEDGKPSAGFPICLAITNIASLLYETSKYTRGPAPLKPYSRQSSDVLQELKRLANTGNFASMNTAAKRIKSTKRLRSGKSNKSASGWMSIG